jgi:hypothetical protein
VLAVFLLANDMVSLAHTWGARYVLTDFYGWLRTVTDLSAAPAADTISVDKRTGGGTVERGGLTVCVYACVCAAGVVCVYVLLQVIFYCLNYSI